MDDQHDAIYPATLFYSYAHEDETLCNDLEKHLTLLQRQGIITAWHDRLILPGVDWAREIDARLNEASIILLLISADFLASAYCYGIEMKRALERHTTKEAHVIPILLRPVDWQSAPFEHLQCLPRHDKPVTEWDNRDAAFRDIAQGIRRVAEQLRRPAHALPTISRQNRQRFLKQVRFWIEGMLKQSLPHTRRIEPELQERPDALENPLQPTIPEWKLLPRPLPAGTSIAQVYDKADGQLLILGEPGAGKTILLLELARTLLERAERDECQRMPVVFNLSSWAEKHQPLTVWLVEELQAKYRVPRKVVQAWVDSSQVLLLLDGLDEVAKDARVACIQAINTYYDRLLEQGPAPLVVCCRSQDYLALPMRVALQRAVSIQPLTEMQINDYLHGTQGQLEGLQQGLRDDPELYKLAHNPLMLNIFTLAYQEAATIDLSREKTPHAKLQQIFATYVERMLHRRSAKMQYPSAQIIRWLAWLAKQMAQHNQTEFHLERMQPDWFSNGWSHHFYNVVVRLGIVLTCWVIFLLPGGLAGGIIFSTGFSLPFGVIFGLLFGLIFGLTSQVKKIITPAEIVGWSWETMWQQLVKIELRNALIRTLPGGLICAFLSGFFLQVSGQKVLQSTASPLAYMLILGTLCGMLGMFLFGLFDGFASEVSRNTVYERPLTKPHQGTWHILRNSLPATLLFGLLVGLVFGLVFRQLMDPTNGLLAGLLFGGASMLVFALTNQIKTNVTLAEVVSWLWKHVRQRAVKTQMRSVFGIGLGIWLMALIIQIGGPVSSLYIALLGAVVIRLLMGIISGLSSDMLAECTLVKPNQGIWSSARNSILVGLAFGIIGGLLFGLIYALAMALQGTLVDALPWVLSFGLIGAVISGLAVGLPNGGIACIQHVVLRFFLRVSRKTPWNYVHFLDYAADCILVRKVGGGYIFIHRLLLEHFASTNT